MFAVFEITLIADETNSSDVLKRFIVDNIRATGPITVAEYMKTAVSAPSVGYYGSYSDAQKASQIRSKKTNSMEITCLNKSFLVFGEKGDFITAPELTQLFGELIGVWCYYELANTGHRGPWQLVECGPGTGQLMSDLLSVMEKFQEKNLSVHLVETSDALIQQQEELLCGGPSTSSALSNDGKEVVVRKNITKTGFPIFWYKTIDDVPEAFSVFVSNEFLDALPVHQFSRDDDGTWHEVYINIDKDNELCFMRSKGENLHTRGLIPEEIRSDRERNHWECSPEAGTFVNQVNPLSRPGAIDLTADVNFGYLKSLIDDRVAVFGPTTQRIIRSRFNCLGIHDNNPVQESYNFLMGDMGEKFLAMCMFPKTLNGILEKRGGPAGFSTLRHSISPRST
ncbi:hypothetical protein NECAME_15679 [Necator americanus]|uniref:Protein arginine methyltransferase NDUFAF7 n=1 Tax=Necator americanus TaxID=51031 RepID=W2SGF7_NECAM|nr:hypothetical protein NECAME_15679 [Necator americanus]ETN68709.1 hypothetical protein NECAME_15679 [Necator americanus]